MSDHKKYKVLCVWRKSGHRFKQNDYKILQEAFIVTIFYFKFTPFHIVKMFILMRKYEVAFAWFANIWAFLMVLFSKVWGTKTVIVAGGHDVAAFVTPKKNALVYCCSKEESKNTTFSRKDQVITVGQIDKKSSVRKGHFEFLEIAKCFSDIQFYHVGQTKDQTIDELKRLAPLNVTYLGYLPDGKYRRVLQESKV